MLTTTLVTNQCTCVVHVLERLAVVHINVWDAALPIKHDHTHIKQACSDIPRRVVVLAAKYAYMYVSVCA